MSDVSELPPVEWQADEADWAGLRTDRYKRAWRLAALSLGLKPVAGIRRLLVSIGRLQERDDYVALKATITNNLTSDEDPDRLTFVKNAENDGRRLKPETRSTERVLDVVVFTEFARRRGIEVHPRMTEIALEITGSREAKDHRIDRQVEVEPQSIGDSGSTRESLTIGLLMMYLRSLAKSGKAPPLSLLKGVNDDINAQALAAAIQEFVTERVDRDGRAAMLASGASLTTLRKTLGTARRYFDNIGDE